jgi:curved DNA-binding protein CbpA
VSRGTGAGAGPAVRMSTEAPLKPFAVRRPPEGARPTLEPDRPAAAPAARRAAGLPDLVRRIHDDALSGVLEVRLPEGRRRLVFVAGELHLTSDHPLAGVLAPILAAFAAEGDAAAGGAAQVRALMTRIAFLLETWGRQGEARLVPREVGGEDLVGPLPTVLVLMEWAAAGDPDSLLARLGGEAAEVVVEPRRSASGALAARLLDPQAAVLLSRLSRATTIADLLRQSAASRSRVLADLARLDAAGLVRRLAAGEPAPHREPITGVAPPRVSPDVVRRVAERVGRELASRPLALDADSHRSRLADLLSRSAGLTAYELLALDATAGDAEIHEAYQRLARLTHPSHAARLELAGGERPLWLLFEQVSAAYLTLSQPERRRRYDRRLAGIAAAAPPKRPRADEERSLARSYYERAEALVEAEDFHFAVELLKQAVHTHPRPEYYVLLGRAQAKNPNWLRHAADSYRKAMELGAEDGRISLALGRLCEEMENFGEARRHYESALARNPAEPDARAGLARLAARTDAGSPDESFGEVRRRWSLSSLFGHRR